MQVRWRVPRRRGTTSHNRTLLPGSTRLETAYFGGWKKFFTLWLAYKLLPQLLGQDFDVNFATYTRVYTVTQAMLNMSTLSTNDQGKSFWELVCGSVNQVPSDHCRWRQLWRSPFPITLQRIFNTRLKNCRLLFSAVISEHFSKKKHDYICSGCKNMVSQKCAVFIGPPCTCMRFSEAHIQYQVHNNSVYPSECLQLAWDFRTVTEVLKDGSNILLF